MRRRINWGAAPGDRELFRGLAAVGENLQRSAELLAELFRDWPDDSSRLRVEISACETRGDELTRRIVHSLHRTKSPPFGRTDLYRLISAVDDVVDDIEEAAEETAIYRIEAPMEQAIELADVLRDASCALSRALSGLDRLADIEPHLLEVRHREQEGDRIYRAALAALFEGGIDPLLIIRWKDVLGAIEEAIDRTRTAADALQGILMRHV